MKLIYVNARKQGKSGVCILSSEGRKREFLSDSGFPYHQGFNIADISDCGITLMHKVLKDDAAPPEFMDRAKHPEAEGDGFTIYYTDQCPFTDYWVHRVDAVAEEHDIPLEIIHINSREKAV